MSNDNVMGIISEYKQNNRVKETLHTRAKKGLYKGSNAPYGYEVQEGKLVIKDDKPQTSLEEFLKSTWLEVAVIVSQSDYTMRESLHLLM
ncbi:hypothetical protein [Neobacillus niacini]|uniref:hypothetical protein n=1 Tax=Neobacillus niacini TaxID=86668 RepID=UPI0020410511|nr:hypothetical protein [Neobacillus niacini]